MARGTTSYYGRRYTIATPMAHLYMLCACIFCWIVGYVDSVGYPVYGEVTAPPLWNALCLVLPGKLFTYLIGFLLMAGGAFLVHRVNYALMLIREKTLLPFLFYALLTSTNPDFFPLKSTSVGVFCFLPHLRPLVNAEAVFHLQLCFCKANFYPPDLHVHNHAKQFHFRHFY